MKKNLRYFYNCPLNYWTLGIYLYPLLCTRVFVLLEGSSWLSQGTEAGFEFFQQEEGHKKWTEQLSMEDSVEMRGQKWTELPKENFGWVCHRENCLWAWETEGGTTVGGTHSPLCKSQAIVWHQSILRPQAWCGHCRMIGKAGVRRSEWGPFGQVSGQVEAAAEDQGRYSSCGGENEVPLRTQNNRANLEANSFQALKGGLVLWSKADGGSVRGYVTNTWKMMYLWLIKEFYNHWNSA